MKCILRCSNESCTFSKYCLHHLYWDDLQYNCNINNLDDDQLLILQKILCHINSKISVVNDFDNLDDKVIYIKNIYKYLSHKKIFLSMHTDFRLACIDKAEKVIQLSDDDELKNLLNLFIKENQK
mgnify:FL=1|tara:strand:- start:3010 stop:3384 length:375 start_codon:yes stop_codon:yes gene_type:complete